MAIHNQIKRHKLNTPFRIGIEREFNHDREVNSDKVELVDEIYSQIDTLHPDYRTLTKQDIYDYITAFERLITTHVTRPGKLDYRLKIPCIGTITTAYVENKQQHIARNTLKAYMIKTFSELF